MDYLITLYILSYIYWKLNAKMKYIYVMILFILYAFCAPNNIMEIIRIIVIIDIIFNIYYMINHDNIYLKIRNNIIALCIIYYFATILPQDYYIGNLLKRYTVHRYGLFD